ncbi:hypothetical protein ACFQYP_42820 [Nonomuraea antimicrobica]
MMAATLLADIAGVGEAGLRGVWVEHGGWPGRGHEAARMVGRVLVGIALIAGGRLSSESSGG